MKSRLFIALVIALGWGAAFIAHAQPPRLHQPLPTINDSALSDYLTQLANDIAARTNSRLNSPVIVLASDSINAYALPGGEIYVTHGLLKAVHNEAEIVFVLAQQLSSLQLPNKLAHRLSAPPQLDKPSAGHKILVGLVSGALITLGGPLGARVGVMIIAQEMGHRVPPRNWSLQTASALFITEADKAAVEYLHAAGYDPEAALAVLEKLRALRPKDYVRQSQLPPPPVTFLERLRLVRNRIARLERKDEYLMDSSTFKLLKDRLGASSPSTDARKLQLKRQLLTPSSNYR
jgi:predicted Zn-dependent protease